MHETASEQASAGETGLTRRQVIARGAAGGAVLWAVPTLQIIGATAADAASGPVVTPPGGEGGPVDPPVAPTEGLPSHGFAVVDGGAGAFVVKIDSSSTGTLSGLGKKDVTFLSEQRLTEGRDYRQPTAADLAAFGAAGDGFGATWYTPAGAASKQAALFLVLPSGFTVRSAYTFDGSLQTRGGGKGGGKEDGGKEGGGKAKGPNGNASDTAQAKAAGKAAGKAADEKGCGDGDKYTSAHVSGRLVYFVADCNEPATGGV